MTPKPCVKRQDVLRHRLLRFNGSLTLDIKRMLVDVTVIASVAAAVRFKLA